MLSVGTTQWGRCIENLPRAVLSQKRHASYTKTPMKKDGSFDSLIYNDAVFRNKLHVLDKNRLKAPEQWKLTAGDLKKTSQTVDDEAFPVPVHRFPFYCTPFSGANGYYVGQQIQYEQILPRCKGKLHKLEWKEVSEEDRYTARNFYMRTHTENVRHTQHMHRDDAGQHERDIWPMMFYAFVLYCLLYAGLPGQNNRSLWSPQNPDDSYNIGMATNALLTTPGISTFFGGFFMGYPQKHIQYHEQYKYPLWTEAEAGVKTVLQNPTNYADLAKAVPQWAFEIRNNGTVKECPTPSFRNDHELYYDGAAGPDRIGAYFVKTWKNGEPIQNIMESHEIGQSNVHHSGAGSRFFL